MPARTRTASRGQTMSSTAYVVAFLRHDRDGATAYAGADIFSEPSPTTTARSTKLVVLDESAADYEGAVRKVHETIRSNPLVYNWLASLLPEKGPGDE